MQALVFSELRQRQSEIGCLVDRDSVVEEREIAFAAWGLISAATAFVRTPAEFYAVRFLLGVAEAGFFPGMVYYLTLWFPEAYRARFTAWFLSAIPLSVVIGGPLAGLILGMDGIAGLRGWQWLFLIELSRHRCSRLPFSNSCPMDRVMRAF